VTAIDRRLTEKDPLMIELTEEQLESTKHGEPLRFHAVEAEFVILRAETYDREQLRQIDLSKMAE